MSVPALVKNASDRDVSLPVARDNSGEHEQTIGPAESSDFPGSFAANTSLVHPKPPARWRAWILQDWRSPSIWRATLLEGIASASLTFISGAFSATIGSYGTNQVAAYIFVFNTVVLSIFIYSTSAASGGHINSLITFTTFMMGLSTPARTILYIVAQFAGAALGGGLLRAGFGPSRSDSLRAIGCFFNPETISSREVFAFESASSFVVLYLAVGVGLDPRSKRVYGSTLGPVLVGLSIGLVTSSTSGLREGYPGAQMNPSRCFGLSSAAGDFSYFWIWIFAPSVAVCVLALVYKAAPPYQSEASRI